MLDSERSSHETDSNSPDGLGSQEEPAGLGQQEEDADRPADGGQEAAAVQAAAPTVPAALFQAPQVLFQPPAPVASPPPGGRDAGVREPGDPAGLRQQENTTADDPGTDSGSGRASRRTARGGRGARGARGSRGDAAAPAPDDDLFSADGAEASEPEAVAAVAAANGDESEEATGSRRRRRRTSRSRGRAEAAEGGDAEAQSDEAAGGSQEPDADEGDAADAPAEGVGAGLDEGAGSGRRRRRKRRRGASDGDVSSPDDPPDTVVHVREASRPADDVRAIKGSTRLEAKKQRRREGRESGRRRPPVVTESEFLARRESVERTMVVRQRGDRTQIAVLEDGVLVEHYVNRTTHQSYVGNVYLGKVQNVLPSMEAAFVDIGKGRNAVLYAGEVNFDASGLEGQPKRIESALKAGQSVIVQVTKDPVGHKGARLTSQVSLPGRYLVYVPGASMTGISRKLPDTERNRLKHILKKVTPENAGVIVRTAAEGAAEAELDRDVTRLAAQWENIEKKAKTATAPALLYGEPDLTIRVVRDVFNEDFSKLIVSGDEGWDTIDEYVRYVAPHLADRLSRWEDAADHDEDVFAAYRVDEQLAKALERKVWLPSGGSLVIDRTEAMTVIDVNTGKFTGQGGNLEETVTRNNLEAAEEIVRQLRLRDVGGIVVIDFIDMVLESNRELVLRRLLECLARDRTKHQVAEVTSLGLVQMTRKRVGAGLLEAFSQPCECCNGRGVIITLDQPEPAHRSSAGHSRRPGAGNGHGNGHSAGVGQSGRPAQERPWQDRPDEDRAAQDRADQDQDRAAQDRAAHGEEGQGGRRGRRDAGDGRNGRTNGGTATASLVEVADTAPAAIPVTVPTDVPPVTPADKADASIDPAAPVRRTRAGSAMARVSVTSEEATRAVPVTVPAPAADPDPANLATAAPATQTLPPTEAAPIAEAAPAEEAAPATEMAPATEEAPATEMAPATEEAPVLDTAPAEPAAAPVEDAAPVTDEAPVLDTAPAEPAAAPVEDAAPVTDEAPVLDTAPAEPAAAPVEDAAPVTDEAAVPVTAPAESAGPIDDAAPTTEAPPVTDASLVTETLDVASVGADSPSAPTETLSGLAASIAEQPQAGDSAAAEGADGGGEIPSPVEAVAPEAALAQETGSADDAAPQVAESPQMEATPGAEVIAVGNEAAVDHASWPASETPGETEAPAEG
jgi:ribonuclease E